MRAQRQLAINYSMSCRNKKNQYLLAGKIRCICGRSRAGEGPQHGKYLYYRCTGRVHSYPLPPTCLEKGIDARISDELVWSEIARLMSSKELLLKQVERWANSKRSKELMPQGDPAVKMKEITKFKEQEERYTKAYGAGLFSLDQLKAYTAPIREKVLALEKEIAEMRRAEAPQMNSAPLPTPSELEAFVANAADSLQSLNFEAKRAIVMNVIDKVVGAAEELQIYGYIPVTNHVELWTSNRDAANTIRHPLYRHSAKAMPF